MKRRTPIASREMPPFQGNRSIDHISDRPPLVPLGLVEHQMQYDYHHREVAQPQRVFFSKSDYSESLRYENEDSDKFELMNITVVIYNLSGIMCEKQSEPRRRSTFGKKERLLSSKGGEDSYGRISGSTISSSEPSPSEEGALLDNIGAATTAVVSYSKNAYSSQTSLETFLPSVPIQNPLSSIGPKYRYQASWPSEQLTMTRDDSAIIRSSFKMTRCMKQEAFVPGAGIGSNYVHETLDLRINLSRGTELLRLGTATLVLSGEEEGEIQMIVPAKPIEIKKKPTRKRVRAKPNKYGFFSGDLTRRFFLDKQSTIRVGIRVLPQHAMTNAEDRERKENSYRQMLGSNELKHMINRMGNINFRNEEMRHTFYDVNDYQREDASGEENENARESLLRDLFCGAFCATDSARQFNMPSDVPNEIHAAEHGHLGVQSLISSVSESTDGSEYDSEEEIEADISSKFLMANAFRHFT